MAIFNFQQIMEEVEPLNETITVMLKELYDTLRGDKSIDEYFEYFYEQYGFSCRDMFFSCHLAGETIDCCQVTTWDCPCN